METYRRESDSTAWLVCVHASFGLACLSALVGIAYLPVDWWVRGYMAMAFLFTIGSSFTLAKTLRDQHEARKLVKKLDDLQTEKILREHVFDQTAPRP